MKASVSDQVFKNFVKYYKCPSIFAITQNMISKLSFTFFTWDRTILFKRNQDFEWVASYWRYRYTEKKVIKVGLSPSKKVVLALMKTVYKRGKIICILS